MTTSLAELTPARPSPGTASTREVVVSVRGLTKIFKDFWGRPKARAVDDVDFDVYRGEVFGLLGPNGSGKSTTVKMLLGLLNPTRGRIEVFDHSPRHVATKARIGYLPEESYLYRYLDSRETLEFFGNLFDLPQGDRDTRTQQLLDMVGLAQVRTRTVGEFSKGMQRRIGLAQALINDPDLVILDEPTSGMDPIGCREVKDLILALARRGKTVILSSHLLADVEDVCDRVVIYYGGKIRAQGPLKELLTERNSVRLTIPALQSDRMERVLDALHKEVPADKVHVDNPTQNLESYFLNVVQMARESDSQTSGATSGSQVAAYLRGDATQEAAAARTRLLDRLTLPQAAPSEPAVAAPSPAPGPSVDLKKLEGLVKGAESTSPQPVIPAEPAASPPVDESKANEKLSGLLGKPK
jgi:ABC-2 type transport system ATP-binding protein